MTQDVQDWIAANACLGDPTIEDIAETFRRNGIGVHDCLEGSEGPVRVVYFDDDKHADVRGEFVALRHGFSIESLRKV